VNQLYRNLVLAGVLVGTGVLSAYACQTDRSPHATTPQAEPAAAQQGGPHAPPPEAAAAAGVQGKVAEVIDVDKYTYLRLVQSGGAEVWAAVPKAKVEKGQQVAIANPQLMRDFKSATLDRTFETIYFGQLAQPGDGTHGPAGAMPPGHPPTDAPGASPGAGPHPPGMGPQSGNGDDIEIGEVDKATGPGAHTIAELFAAKASLPGQQVRVRGVVVKAVPNVMNRSFVHLRDGTGDAKAGTHDVTVTMATAPPQLGAKVMVEGTVAIERDFGAGYTYPLLIEDAKLVNE
jgi:hypothetical protein